MFAKNTCYKKTWVGLFAFFMAMSLTIAAIASEDHVNPRPDLDSYHLSQLDPRWANEPYWSNQPGYSVADCGCGLCAYTSMVNYLTSSSYDPLEMNSFRRAYLLEHPVWGGYTRYNAWWYGHDGNVDKASISSAMFGLDSLGVYKSSEGWTSSRLFNKLYGILDRYGKNAVGFISAGTTNSYYDPVFYNSDYTTKGTGGHYVLGLAAADEKLIVMDPSSQPDFTKNTVYTKDQATSMFMNPRYYPYVHVYRGTNYAAENTEHIGSGISGWIRGEGGSWLYSKADDSIATDEFLKVGSSTYYFNDAGAMLTGWQKIDGSWYCFASSGAMYSNCYVGSYWMGSDGALVTNNSTTAHWGSNSSGWWYVDEAGAYVRNSFKVIDGETYYFNADGWMTVGWKSINGDWYYFNGNGYMQTNSTISGWTIDDKGIAHAPKRTEGVWNSDYYGWWYTDVDGDYVRSQFKTIKGHTYYFGPDGYMAVGWKKIDGAWYYFSGYGYMQTNTTISGWTIDDKGVAHAPASSSGGWKSNSYGWWYVDARGSYLVSQFKTIGGHTYYFDASGWMSVGWTQVGSDWYYFSSYGYMKTNGWRGNYYFGSDGKMLTNAKTPDGYWVDSTGHWVA